MNWLFCHCLFIGWLQTLLFLSQNKIRTFAPITFLQIPAPCMHDYSFRFLITIFWMDVKFQVVSMRDTVHFTLELNSTSARHHRIECDHEWQTRTLDKKCDRGLLGVIFSNVFDAFFFSLSRKRQFVKRNKTIQGVLSWQNHWVQSQMTNGPRQLFEN